MRSGILSDGFIQSHNPAFFPDHTPRRKRAPPRTRIIKRAVIPYYDLYAVARETMENPFDGARELILNYRPGAPAPPQGAAPVPSVYDVQRRHVLAAEGDVASEEDEDGPYDEFNANQLHTPSRQPQQGEPSSAELRASGLYNLYHGVRREQGNIINSALRSGNNFRRAVQNVFSPEPRIVPHAGGADDDMSV